MNRAQIAKNILDDARVTPGAHSADIKGELMQLAATSSYLSGDFFLS